MVIVCACNGLGVSCSPSYILVDLICIGLWSGFYSLALVIFRLAAGYCLFSPTSASGLGAQVGPLLEEAFS